MDRIRKSCGRGHRTVLCVGAMVVTLGAPVMSAYGAAAPATDLSVEPFPNVFVQAELLQSVFVQFDPTQTEVAQTVAVPEDETVLTAEPMRTFIARIEERMRLGTALTETEQFMSDLSTFAGKYRSSRLEDDEKHLRTAIFVRLAALHQFPGSQVPPLLALAANRAKIMVIDPVWIRDEPVQDAAVQLLQDLRGMLDTTGFEGQSFGIGETFRTVSARIETAAGPALAAKIRIRAIDPLDSSDVHQTLGIRWADTVIQTRDSGIIADKLRLLGGMQPCESPESRLRAWEQLNDLVFALRSAVQAVEGVSTTEGFEWIPTSTIDFADLFERGIRAQLQLYRSDPDLFSSVDTLLVAQTAQILEQDTIDEIERILFSGAPNPEELITPLMLRLARWGRNSSAAEAVAAILAAAETRDLRRYAAYALERTRPENIISDAVSRLREMLNSTEDQELQIAGLLGLSGVEYICPALSESDGRIAIELFYSIMASERYAIGRGSVRDLIFRCKLVSPSNELWLRNGLLAMVKRMSEQEPWPGSSRWMDVSSRAAFQAIGLHARINVPSVDDVERGCRVILLKMLDDVIEVDQNFYSKLIILRALLSSRYVTESELNSGTPIAGDYGPIDQLHELVISHGYEALSAENREFYDALFEKTAVLRERITNEWLTTITPGIEYRPSASLRDRMAQVGIADLPTTPTDEDRETLFRGVGSLLRVLEMLL